MTLAKAGLLITDATKACYVQDTRTQRELCSADVNGIIGAFGVVAAFLSKAASQCAETADINALCSGDASGLIASLANVASTASGAAALCKSEKLDTAEDRLDK